MLSPFRQELDLLVSAGCVRHGSQHQCQVFTVKSGEDVSQLDPRFRSQRGGNKEQPSFSAGQRSRVFGDRSKVEPVATAIFLYPRPALSSEATVKGVQEQLDPSLEAVRAPRP